MDHWVALEDVLKAHRAPGRWRTPTTPRACRCTSRACRRRRHGTGRRLRPGGHPPGGAHARVDRAALPRPGPGGAPHLFTGDSLFPGGVGNTRGNAEDFASLIDDVEHKLFDRLPDETWFYPGHGKDSHAGRRAAGAAGVARPRLVARCRGHCVCTSDARCGPTSRGRDASWHIRFRPASACGLRRAGAMRSRATRRSMRRRPADTVASWAQQTDPDFRFVIKLPKLDHARAPAGRRRRGAPGLPGRDRATRPAGPCALDPVAGIVHPSRRPRPRRLPAPAPRSHRYAVEVRHRAFFDDPARPGCSRDVLSAAAAEWIPFDTTAFFQSPRPATRNETRGPRNRVCRSDPSR